MINFIPYVFDLYRVISVSRGDMSGPQGPGGVGESWFSGHFIPDSGKRVAQSIQISEMHLITPTIVDAIHIFQSLTDVFNLLIKN